MDYIDDDIKVTLDSVEEIKTTLSTGSIVQYGQLEIGTTTTGEAGTEAVVTNSGSAAHAILNFTIPRGEPGIQGEPGEDGKDGKNGEDGIGIPSGGAAGQVLAKASNDDYDTMWITGGTGGGGEGGTTNYEELINKPKINNVALSGNKTLDELGIQPSGDYLTEDDLIEKGYVIEETDPTVPAHVKAITAEEIAKWNAGTGGGGISDETDPTVPEHVKKITKSEIDKWNAERIEPIMFDTLPIGTMLAYGDVYAPSNWLICDGSEVSRTTYAELFEVIGTKYGEGDGSTTFNLPNKKGKVSVGWDMGDNLFHTIGNTGGEKEVQLTLEQMPSHTHNLNVATVGSTSKFGDGYIPMGNSYSLNSNYMTHSKGGSEPHTNLQPYEVDNWIIKVFQQESVIGKEVPVAQDLTSNSADVVPSVAAVNNGITDLIRNTSSELVPTVVNRELDSRLDGIIGIQVGGSQPAAPASGTILWIDTENSGS